MAVRPILLWPDPLLSQICRPVAFGSPGVAQLAEDLIDSLYAARGRGLAAPQIGVMQRAFVMDSGWKDGAPAPGVFINPVVLERSDVMATNTEGCLSIPGVPVEVMRAEAVELEWSDLTGARHTGRFAGFDAICAQHEIDHLDGIVIFDRIPAEVRSGLEGAYLNPPARPEDTVE